MRVSARNERLKSDPTLTPEGFPMIRAMLYDTKSADLESGDERLIESWKNDPNKLIWVDLYQAPAEEERQLL